MCFHWCTHLRYGHKLTGSYLIPCAFSGATESASVSHDRREPSTSEHGQRSHLLTCPAGIREPRNSPTGTALAQGSCANGADHADSLGRRHALVNGQGRRSTRPSFQFCQVVNGLSTSCQPVNDRDQTAHQAMQTSSFDHGHCKLATIDPERLTVAWWPIYQFIATMNSKSGSGNVNKHHLFLNNFIAVYTK